MRLPALLLSSLAALLSGCAAVDELSNSVQANVSAQLTGQSAVVGSVEVIAPGVGWVTCFKGTNGSAFSRRPITSISQAEGFPLLIVTKASVGASGQCSELIKMGLISPGGGSAAAAGSGGRPADYRNIKDTELAGFFERNPQPGAGKVAEWPRVAITLVDAPNWRYELPYVRFANGQIGNDKPEPGFGCWTFKARIWTSATASRDVPAFHHCSGDTLVVPGMGNIHNYQIWTGIIGSNVTRETRGSTGINRTEGPVYPDTPLPVTGPYRRANFFDSFTGRIVSAVFLSTGVDFQAFQEHRLWLTVASAIAPQ